MRKSSHGRARRLAAFAALVAGGFLLADAMYVHYTRHVTLRISGQLSEPDLRLSGRVVDGKWSFVQSTNSIRETAQPLGFEIILDGPDIRPAGRWGRTQSTTFYRFEHGMWGGVVPGPPARPLSADEMERLRNDLESWLLARSSTSPSAAKALLVLRHFRERGAESTKPGEYWGNVQRVHWRGYLHNAVASLAAVVLLASGAIFAHRTFRQWIESRRQARGQCRMCGYDVSHNRDATCPECGTAITAVDVGR